MYKLYTDKPELFECDVKITGARLSDSMARLVVETSDYSIMFNGKIDSGGKCEIPIRKLRGLIDEDTKGTIRLEIIAEDTYFTPWTSDFEVQASKQVTVEVRSRDNDTVIQESATVSNVKAHDEDVQGPSNGDSQEPVHVVRKSLKQRWDRDKYNAYMRANRHRWKKAKAQ